MARMRTTTWTTIDPHIAAAEERICADWNRLHGDADPRIWAYIDDVLSGRVLACQKVRLAYERFVRDLMHEEEGDFPWRFDAEKASKPIRFVEKFVRPQGDYDRLTLMPWQCAFYAALFGWVSKKDGTRKHNKCLLIVGSGNGKTPMIAGAALYSVSQEGIKNAEIDEQQTAGADFHARCQCGNRRVNGAVEEVSRPALLRGILCGRAVRQGTQRNAG